MSYATALNICFCVILIASYPLPAADICALVLVGFRRPRSHVGGIRPAWPQKARAIGPYQSTASAVAPLLADYLIFRLRFLTDITSLIICTSAGSSVRVTFAWHANPILHTLRICLPALERITNKQLLLILSARISRVPFS